jgi:hypothetical protein
MALSKQDLARAEAALQNEEQTLKEKWCVLKGHRFDLPAANPINQPLEMTHCQIRCNRCNCTATLSITVDRKPDQPTIVAPVTPSK